ncbi:PEP-CTERM sorting domain-containing protein [Myxococcota bacterium]|nr:PEP-CTERM sorting domain-containing protein [Myxococcota bacterium]
MKVAAHPAPHAHGRFALGARAARSATLFVALAVAILPVVAPRMAHAVATPFKQTGVALANLATEVTFSVDMSTLPLRPKLIVEAMPDATHGDMSLQLTITNCNFTYAPEIPYFCDQSFPPGHLPRISAPGTGPRSVDFQPFDCGAIEPNSPPYVGKTCDVKVKALNFGTAGAPATFDITIRGETVVPSATYSAQVSTSLSDSLPLGSVEYFNENQNFRWIYDLNNDNVLITPVAGRCEFTPPANHQTIAFGYQFQGSPTYQGLDCCTWQVGSLTGVTGTGQAIFYINVDANNPANQPADSDIDGIKNLCDNCPTRPNGPLLGSCISGTKIGKLCKSNQQCPGGACSLAQEDANRALPGDACVPEPGLGAMLGAGIGGLAWLTRRSKQSQ